MIFEKSPSLIAVRARAGMAAAMEADIGSIGLADRARRRSVGAFEVIELRPSLVGIEQDLDWLRSRPAVAAASHVFSIRGQAALMVPDGHVHVQFERAVPGHEQQVILTRYRLQAIEQRGDGDYLVRITIGSKNPIATAAALQIEPSVKLAEPEFAETG